MTGLERVKGVFTELYLATFTVNEKTPKSSNLGPKVCTVCTPLLL